MADIELRGFTGLSDVQGWLERLGVREIVVKEGDGRLFLDGETAGGPLQLRIFGMVPNSLFWTGAFVPLTLRVEVGKAPDQLEAYGALHRDGALWQGVVGERYRAAALCASDTLSPLDELSMSKIMTFLEWAGGFVVQDQPAPVHTLDAACRRTAANRSLWTRLTHSWSEPWVPHAAENRDARDRVGKALGTSEFWRITDELPGSRQGLIEVVHRFRAVATAAGLELEADLFRLHRPRVSSAVDPFFVDVDLLEASAGLLPGAWLAIRISGPKDIGLGEVEHFWSVQGNSAVVTWLDGDQLKQGAFDQLLADIAFAVTARGPYR